jgi:hypothetical protein
VAQSPVTPVPSPSSAPAVSAATALSAIRGIAFFDAEAKGERTNNDSQYGLGQVDITLSLPNGLARIARTADDGSFTFDGVAPGSYRVTVALPVDYVSTTDAGQDIEVAAGADTDGLLFGLTTSKSSPWPPSARCRCGSPKAATWWPRFNGASWATGWCGSVCHSAHRSMAATFST